MDTTSAIAACAGCRRREFSLIVIDGAQLCAGCAEKSARIDRKLAGLRSDNRVTCDGCSCVVDFDARVAVVARECGGAVLCEDCKAVVIKGASS